MQRFMRRPSHATARPNHCHGAFDPVRRGALVLLCVPMLLALGTGPVAAAPAAAPAAKAPAATPPIAAKAATSSAGAASQRGGLWTPGVRDAAHPGRWAREFERRKAVLRAPGPEAVLALLGALLELQGEIPGPELLAFLDGAHKHREPLVASYAGYLRAQLAEAGGDQATATAGYRREGYLIDWQIVGPFENSSRAGQAAVYGPETLAFAPGQSFAGKLPAEPLTWRRFLHEQAPRGAFVTLGDLLHPHEQATG